MTQIPEGWEGTIEPTPGLLTPPRLRAIMPRCAEDLWCPHLVAAAERWDILPPHRMAVWLAQIAVESGEMSRMTENLYYKNPADLVRLFLAIPTLEVAQGYIRSPERLADLVYANRLGNGPEASGDGWRFRGRGLIQLTGRANYTAYAAVSGLALVGGPELLLVPANAADSAGWFWQVRGLGEIADAADVALRSGDEPAAVRAFRTLTRRVNAGLEGIDRRIAYWRTGRSVLT